MFTVLHSLAAAGGFLAHAARNGPSSAAILTENGPKAQQLWIRLLVNDCYASTISNKTMPEAGRQAGLSFKPPVKPVVLRRINQDMFGNRLIHQCCRLHIGKLSETCRQRLKANLIAIITRLSMV